MKSDTNKCIYIILIIMFLTVSCSGSGTNISVKTDSRPSVSDPDETDVFFREENLKRCLSYCNSEESHLAYAEKMAELIGNPLKKDQLLSHIAKGYAGIGCLDHAFEIINKKITLNLFKAWGKTFVAETLYRYGYKSKAYKLLKEAEQLTLAIFNENKTSISYVERNSIYQIVKTYAQYGYMKDAERVIDFCITEYKPDKPQDNTPIFVLSAFYTAKQYLKNGDVESARKLTDKIYKVVKSQKISEKPLNVDPPNKIPPYITNFYWSMQQPTRPKALKLIKIAELYDMTGDKNKIPAVYRDVSAIWELELQGKHPGVGTGVFIPKLAGILYKNGFEKEALKLANSIPDTYNYNLGEITGTDNSTIRYHRAKLRNHSKSAIRHRIKCFQKIAIQIAAREGADSAVAFTRKHITDPEDIVRTLVFFTRNKKSVSVAGTLIKKNEFIEAQKAIKAAEVVLQNLEEHDDDKNRHIRINGYLKIAGLYFMAGETDKTISALKEAEKTAAGLSGRMQRMKADISIGKAWGPVNPEISNTMLQHAADRLLSMENGGDNVKYQYRMLRQLILPLKDAGGPEDAEKLISKFFFSESVSTYTDYSKNNYSRINERDTEKILLTANLYNHLGDYPNAVRMTDRAWEFATVNNSEKCSNYTMIKIFKSYSSSGDFQKAFEIAKKTDFSMDDFKALYSTTLEYIARRDDFKKSRVASIDLDGDGKPFFFNPISTLSEIRKSGLVFDSDTEPSEKMRQQ